MAKSETSCTDRVVGAILSSWRYDISGISPEMRRDYEQHLNECEHCRGRQSLHRKIDVSLAGFTFAAVLLSLIALALIYRVQPLQNWVIAGLHLQSLPFVLSLKAIAVGGVIVSIVAFLLVTMMTPAPVYLGGVAMAHARELQERIPKEFRRFPRDL